MTWLATIALLCAVHGSDSWLSTISRHQLDCQQYYIKCARDKRAASNAILPQDIDAALEQCILEKK